MAVCTGGAGLAPEERAELLAVLTRDREDAVAQRAANALLSVPLESLVAALAKADAAPELFGYCASNLDDKPGIADAMAQNAACPPEIVVSVAKHFSAGVAQELADNLERLSAVPGLAAVLADSPLLTGEQRNRLQELTKDTTDEAALAEVIAAAEADSTKRQTLLQRLGKMRVVERIKAALTGNREERAILIRDPNKMVQRAVLQSPRLTDNDVESFSAMANLSDETLRIIANNRRFIKNYVVVRNLVNNPKTPIDVSLHLLPRVNPQDLKFLTMNKNVPETLRSTAIKLHRQRSQAKPGGLE